MTHSVARVTLWNPKYDLVLPVMKTFQDRVQLPKFITHSLSQSGLNLPLFSLIFSEVYLDTLEFGFIFIFLIEIQARFWILESVVWDLCGKFSNIISQNMASALFPVSSPSEMPFKHTLFLLILSLVYFFILLLFHITF